MKNIFKTAAGKQGPAERFANQIDAMLEKGERPWFQPWKNGNTARIMCPVNQAGTPYRGINTFMLWEAATRNGFNNPNWMTLRQANRLGGHVLKGEHHTPIIWAGTETKTEMEDGEEKERRFPVRKTFQLFNAQQIEGLPEHYYDKAPERLPVSDRIKNAEEFFAAAGADIRHGGNKAYYSLGGDYIRMPDRHLFKDDESYMQTLAHEYAHWTRHPSRLARDFGRQKFGDEGYAREELVAELASVILCAHLDLIPEPREENAAYIGHWQKMIKGNPKIVSIAMSEAQKAADFIISAHEPASPDMTQEIDHDVYAEPAPTPRSVAARIMQGPGF